MHDANHCLGMLYMAQNLCFRKPTIISVVNLISLSGLEEKKLSGNVSSKQFWHSFQLYNPIIVTANGLGRKMSFQESRSHPGIALDKEAAALGSSGLGEEWWDLLLALQALQRAHLPADNRKIGGHPPLSSWNFPPCWRNLQTEFKFCGCWCCAFGRDT